VTAVGWAAQPVTATAAANRTAVRMRAGRMATSFCRWVTLWVQNLSVAGAGHGRTPAERRGNAERDSTRSQLSIGTSTPCCL
jgi:hypothetical protein